MRVTFQYQSSLYQKSMTGTLNSALEAQQALLAGRTLMNPESSPSSYVMAYNLQNTINEITKFSETAQHANGWLQTTEAYLLSALDLIQEARQEIANGANNDTLSYEAYQAYAAQIMSIYDELFAMANSQYMGKYIFGGYQTNTQPFQTSANTVTGITSVYGTGASINASKVFSDLPELDSGKYTVQVRVVGDTGYLSVIDKYGNAVVLDSNGSDDSTGTGNNLTTEMSFKIEPGAVIDTGRGISITIPEDGNMTGLKYNFNYKAGSNAAYYGDSGVINNRVGYTQDIPINMPGSSLFTSMNRILKGNFLSTISGLAVNASTKFSQIAKANTGIGDTMRVSGTDHNGRQVGAASATATEEAKLNLANASEEERTLVLGYGGKYYQIVVPAENYATTEDLQNAINNQLKYATYAGSQTLYNSYADTEDMANRHNAEINAGLNNTDNIVDLSKEIQVVLDGNRLSFATTNTGNHTAISVTGFKHNGLGFDDKTVAGVGKDTVFDIGYDYTEDGIASLYTQHQGIDLGAANDPAVFYINGVQVTVAGLSNPALSTEDKEYLIDEAIRKAGFGHTVTVKLDDLGGDIYDITFTHQNVEFDQTTSLTTMCEDGAGKDYQMAECPRTYYTAGDKSVQDFLNFITDLYGDGVKAYVENGCIMVEDIRSGESKLTMNIYENNEGINLFSSTGGAVVSGNYDGGYDDEWDIQVTMNDTGGGTQEVIIQVYDKNGILIKDMTVDNYTGGEIFLRKGVSITLDDMLAGGLATASQSLKVQLTAGGTLDFGNMTVAQEGQHVDMFESLMNLYNAIAYAVTGEGGWNAPSAWRDENYISSANPYFGGIFTGNYNSEFKYTVQSSDSQRSYYVQNEFTHTTGKLNLINDPTVTSLNYSVQLYDNTTGQMIDYPMSISLAGITTEAELAEAIAKAVNNDQTLYDNGVHATVKNGQVVFESGSGAKNITIVPADQNAIYMMGLEAQSGSPLQLEFPDGASFDMQWYDMGTNSWVTESVVIPPGSSYADVNAVLTAINAQLGSGGSDMTASVVDGVLTFSSASNAPFYYDNVSNPGNALGINNITQNYISGSSNVIYDLSDQSAEARTLTFRYTDGLGDHEVNITLDAKAYENMDELLEEINDKLAAAGLTGVFNAVAYGDNGIAFEPGAGVTCVSIEGDYDGTLGFPRTGDRVTVTVTDQDGKVIQNIYVDTANKDYGVADGLLLGFDRGSLTGYDSFTGAVGSGIEYEMGILDQVEQTLVLAIAKLGTLGAQVESVLTFNTLVLETSENQKAVYTGSTAADLITLTSKATAAETAYEYALALSARMLSFSILDYIR